MTSRDQIVLGKKVGIHSVSIYLHRSVAHAPPKTTGITRKMPRLGRGSNHGEPTPLTPALRCSDSVYPLRGVYDDANDEAGGKVDPTHDTGFLQGPAPFLETSY